jgi:hypothetical protein
VQRIALGLDGPDPPINGLCHRDILGFLEIGLVNFLILNLPHPPLYRVALIAIQLGIVLSLIPGACLDRQAPVRGSFNFRRKRSVRF